MPSPSAARPRGSILRQLSLQSQPQTQPPAGRRGLKKQLSEDDGQNRTIDAVEVTGHGWQTTVGNGEKTDAGLRSPDVSKGFKGSNGIRPRPVKLAWADRKQESAECPTGVEVVARKCQGQPRPLTVKAQRMGNLPLPDKDTLVYTRQQLAERLRVAWREREKNKPNLNIFLAHAADAKREGNDDSSTTRSSGVGGLSPGDVLVRDSVAFATGSEISSGTDRHSRTDGLPSSKTEVDSMRDAESSGSILQIRTPDNAICSVDSPDFKIFPVSEIGNLFRTTDQNAGVRPKEKENSDSSPRSDSGFSEQSKAGKLDELNEKVSGNCIGVLVGDGEKKAQGTAQERRASFRSGGPLCKTIDECYSPPGGNSSDEAEEIAPRDGEIKVILKKNEEERPPLTRTLSAPTRNETPKTTRSTPPPKANVTFKVLPRYASSIDLSGFDQDLNALRGRIKSAPTRRRLKMAASRRKHRDKDDGDSSDDEKPARDASKKKAATRRRGATRGNGNDIVTMVSLVSPATSDADESAIPLPEDAWTVDERDEKEGEEEGTKKPEGGHPPKEISSFIIQKFVSLRKTNKTVSFVQHPPINRSYSASFPSRRVPAGTPIIIPTPVITNPALTPAQLQQEREKRSQTTPQVSVQVPVTDNRGVKRRLIRATSAPQVKENEGEVTARGKAEANLSVKEFERIAEESTGDDKENGEEGELKKKEPEFKSAKEKECWKLYQKMVEKGVSVSFDTVLRGMLTPTEYRLRRNQLLSTC